MSTAETLNNDLRLENFFVGDFLSNGIIVKPNGKLIRRFKVEGQSNFKKGTLTLNEKFTYDDGEVDKRVWQILCLPDGSYEGYTTDLVGPPPRNHPTENLFSWSYRLKLPVKNMPVTLRFTDMMHFNNNAISNVATISKFGLPVLKIFQTFNKV